MSQGQGSFQTNQRTIPQSPPGPPFIPTSANNGLSVDPITGKIVLGQDVGALGDPAQLLNNREIPMAGFNLSIFDLASGSLLDMDNAGGLYSFRSGAAGGNDSSLLLGAAAQSAILEANNLPFPSKAEILMLAQPGTELLSLFTTNALSQQTFNSLDGVNGTWRAFSSANKTFLRMSDFNQRVDAGLDPGPTARFFLLDMLTDIYQLGDVDASTAGKSLFTIDNFNGFIASQTGNFTASETLQSDSVNIASWGVSIASNPANYQAGFQASLDAIAIQAFANMSSFATGTPHGAFQWTVDAANQFFKAFTGLGQMLLLDGANNIYKIGDIDGTISQGNFAAVDNANDRFILDNTASNIVVKINGTDGFTGTVAAPATITVDGGIVTNVA